MRVLLFDTGRSWRGGQRQVALLGAGLKRRGHYVHAATPSAAPLSEALESDGIPVTSVGPRFDLDLGAAMRLAQASRAFRADVVHAHDAKAHGVARLAQSCGLRGKLVVTRRTHRPPRSRLKYRWGVDRYLAVSRAVRRSLVSHGIPRQLVTVIYSGIPRPSPTETAYDRCRLGVKEGDCLIVAMCALTPEKRVDSIIAAAALGRREGFRAEWVVLGDGPLRDRLARMAAEEHAPVFLHGFKRNFGPILRAADVFVHTPDAEALGTAVLEAVARGVPVVATSVGGIPEAISADTGTLLTGRHPATILRAVRAWMADPERRTKVRRLGPSAAAQFDSEHMIDGTIQAYGSLLGGKGGARRTVTMRYS